MNTSRKLAKRNETQQATYNLLRWVAPREVVEMGNLQLAPLGFAP